MEEEDEIRYILKYEEHEAKKSSNLEYFKREISRNGSLLFQDNDKEVKVYNASLSLVFSEILYPASNLENHEDCEINGNSYLSTYILGFYDGAEFFKSNFSTSQEVLYGPHSKEYIENLRINYFETCHEPFRAGWVSIKDLSPVIIYHGVIKRYGYYSGIVTEVESLVEKHKAVFKGFVKERKSIPVLLTDTGKTRSDFTKENLKRVTLQLLNSPEYESPMVVLNELLREVEQFNDDHLRIQLFLNVHYLLKENFDADFHVSHREEITLWLNKSKIIGFKDDLSQKKLFDTTWIQNASDSDNPGVDILKENSSPIKQNETRKIINKYFERAKDECFSEKDYQRFAQRLTDFFEHKPVNQTDGVILLKYSKKTLILSILKPLYRELKEGSLRSDTGFWKLFNN